MTDTMPSLRARALIAVAAAGLLAACGSGSSGGAGATGGAGGGAAAHALVTFGGTVQAIDQAHRVVRTTEGDFDLATETFTVVPQNARPQTTNINYSPNGERLAFGVGTQLYVRDLDDPNATTASMLTPAEAGSGAYNNVFTPFIDDAGDTAVYTRQSPRSVIYVKERDVAPAMPPFDPSAPAPLALAGDGLHALTGARVTDGTRYHKGELWWLDVAALTSTPFWFDDAGGAPLVTTALRVAARADLGSIAVVRDADSRISVYDVASHTLTDVCAGMYAHYATLPDAGASHADLGLYRGDFLTVYLNDSSSDQQRNGAKMAYLCNVVTGETFAIGVTSEGARQQVIALVGADPGPPTAPLVGTPLTGPGWQYEGAAPVDDGQAAVISVIWSAGAALGTTSHISILVPRSSFTPVAP